MLPVAPIEPAELLLGASQADLESFNLAEPAFAFGLGNAGDEVVADLVDAGALDRVRPEKRTSDASIRCPMLRVDPAQCRRLAEIIRNLGDRIDEARAYDWAGEVQGLRISLEAARNKLASLNRLARNNRRTTVNLGMPIIRGKLQ
ncbi:hypothetical protein OG339_22245 [Streptosporangium sp. NBC_01495]|uniref:hypothetical protein n=1 Tax=Streptosporangium sp. NBC_01495 TaxID=2903899 RepID=UPI002E31FB9F|nr:hypothetical protein [Streptosporangium sp. NBC_01495]